MAKTYSQLNFHLVWHTKNNEPHLDKETEVFVHSCIAQKCKQKGYRLLEVNSVENHIHLLVSLRPTDLISEFAHSIKGSSSHDINKKFHGRKKLSWQTGYSVTSISPKDIPMIREYIRRQKEHHEKGLTNESLEETERTDD